MVGGSAGGLGNQSCIVEQHALGCAKARLIEVSAGDGRDGLIRCSLNPQEVGMTVDSIRAAVQGRDIRSEHLFVVP